MILDLVKKHAEVFQQRRDANTGASVRTERKLMHSLVLGLTAASVVAIAPAAFSQSTDSLAILPATTSAPAVSPQLLSAAQMERIADILLGLLYFVLPVGFGLGIFLHDRQQQHRASILEEQIKLLEKLWEQSPQA